MSIRSAKPTNVTMRTRNRLTGLLFFSPWLIGFLIFTLYPTVFSFLLSLNQYQIQFGRTTLVWRGLTYYNMAWNIDTWFKVCLWDTVLLIACATPVLLAVSLIIAVLLNQKFPLRTFFRSVFFMPVIIMSGPVVNTLLNGETTDFSQTSPGVYRFLNALPALLSKPSMIILNNLVLILWFSGVQILVFLAGLQKISPDLYSAAEIDGAGSWEKFWKITLPHVKPLILLNTVFTVMTLSNYSNNEVNLKIANSVMQTSALYSFSAAMAWIYFVALAAVILIIFGLFAIFQKKERVKYV